MNDTSPEFEILNLEKVYGGRTVLRIEQLQIRQGERLCLIGPTGAGKSTLLRLLSGLESPSTGVLRIGKNHASSNGAPIGVQRRTTLVFQKPLLLNCSVQANVECGLKARGAKYSGQTASKILEQLGLLGLAKRQARTLSGGEIQLVALGRALALDPDVLLLDEPTSNLDPGRVALVENVIAELHRERRCTIVWATHNMFQARRVAERTALMLETQLIEVRPTREFFLAPRDPRTAAFVSGDMVY